MTYSLHAKNRLEKLIRETQPDIAHLHMIDHQISPSILHTLNKFKIPVIQTVHQYKLVCPNYRMYIPQKNEVCDRCLNGNYFNAILQRCHKDSLFASAMVAFETTLHRWMRIYEKYVDLFHVPSHFMAEKLKAGGIPEDKIEHQFYTLNLDDYTYSKSASKYFMYYGRLAPEKGVATLLKALKSVNSDAQLFIVGEGPEKAPLMQYSDEHNLNNVSFLGYKSGDELSQLIADSQFVVVPSEWYDNSPLVIYESLSMGKPVIGSDLGGIPELIDDGTDGFVFKAGDEKMLAEKINQLYSDKKLAKNFGLNGRAKAEKNFSHDAHYKWIFERYQTLLADNENY